MDEIYRTVPIEEIPWIKNCPSGGLVKFVEGELGSGGSVKPRKTIVLGCGTGTNAIYLAEQGFEVTGVDISPTAIELAKKNAQMRGVNCTFVSADIRNDLSDIVGNEFGFVLTWQVLHHIFPEHRKAFVKNVHGLLETGSTFLSVCFSEKNRNFGGVGKIRRSSLGTDLYFSSENELRELFGQMFRIMELKTMEIPGKPEPHDVIFSFMKKK